MDNKKCRAAVVCLNPCMDRMLHLGKPLTPGDNHRVENTVENPGGKGLNVAVMLTRFGVETDYFAFGNASDDDRMNGYILSQKFSYHKTVAVCGVRQNVKIVDSAGIGTEINEAGGPILPAERQAILTDISAYRGDILFLNGSIPQGVEKSVYKSLIEDAKKRNIRCILDADGEALREGLRAGPAYIKPNRRELGGLIGRTEAGMDEATVLRTGKEIFEKYGTGVLCTLDAEGSVYFGAEGIFRVGVAKMPLCSFVGAGDTYLAAFVAARHGQGQSVEASLAYAARASAAKIALPGTVLPTLDQINAVGEVDVRKIG